MKPKYLLLFLILIILAGCRKTQPEDTIGSEPPIPPVANVVFSVAKVWQSNMVVQRDKPLKIWGTANATNKVTVTVSWNLASFSSLANNVGSWEITIPAAPANATPQTITISTPGANAVVLENILIGDVWLCSGQSNMVMPLGNIAPFTGVENYSDEIAAANYPQVRSLTVIPDTRTAPIADFSQKPEWKTCTPENAEGLSAAAYFFARKLNTELHVPVGIIVSAINGSWCENWMNKDAFQAVQGVGAYLSSQSSTLYNGMISPLTKLSIKGFIWYQGENDQKLSPVSDYTKLNMALIKGWRAAFGQGDLPFYYVQLTPFDETGSGDITLNWLAKFREAQAAVRTVPVSGMAITMDAGEVANHHPKYKKQVGERLALLALNNAYGLEVQSVGPQYQSYVEAGDKVMISFLAGTANGLSTLNGKPLNQHFFVAGADHVFQQAMAEINDDKIILTIPLAISTPVLAVRYAFSNFPITNLQNSAGLPMEPFRTDGWDN